MYTIPLKPMSQNEAWKGRRYKTEDHKHYAKVLKILLRKLDLPRLQPKTKYYVYYRFYISSRSDYDNPIKAWQDCLAEVLGIDDRYIFAAFVEKITVRKGGEKIEFNIFQDQHDLIRAINEEVPLC